MSRLMVVEVPSYSSEFKGIREVCELVRCRECKHGEYREEFDDYECHASGCGLVHDVDFYCADGCRDLEKLNSLERSSE